MSTVTMTQEQAQLRRHSQLAAWGLVVGGVLFFAGGLLHPKEDPPGVSLKEHMRVMFDDPAWYPAHAVVLLGMAILAAALVELVRGRTLSGFPRAQFAAVVAAVASSLAAAGMLLHLVSAVEADKIAAGRPTPIIAVQVIVETITVPAFAFSIAALAVIGAMTRTLGNWVAAVPAVLGGLGFGLAGGTFLLTDALDPLFPAAAGIALWAIAAGIGQLRRRRAASAAPHTA
jgi:hypothetical protein